MYNIYNKENSVILKAEGLLTSEIFNTNETRKAYSELLYDYKDLLRQMMAVVKMSDMIQLQLKNLTCDLETASVIDVLTGVYNRRYFDEVFAQKLEEAAKEKMIISLIMIDIDFFKRYNDTYGHLKGDECLKIVTTEIIRNINNPQNFITRFGGEEFIIVLPDTDEEKARMIAKSIIESTYQLNIEHLGSPKYKKVTLSAGIVSVLPNEMMNKEIIISRADDALYSAKNAGKNCYKIWDVNTLTQA